MVTGKWDICYLAHLMVTLAAYTFCGVSLLTLTAISVDRLLALLLGLRQTRCNCEKDIHRQIHQLLQLYESMFTTQIHRGA